MTKSPIVGFGPRSHFSSQINLEHGQPSYSASPSKIRNQTIALGDVDRRKDSPPGELSAAGQSNLSLLLQKSPSPPQDKSTPTIAVDKAQESINPKINVIAPDDSSNTENPDPRDESTSLLNNSAVLAYNYGNFIRPDNLISTEDRSFVEKVYDWLPCTGNVDGRHELRRPIFNCTPENIFRQVILNPISYIPAVILGLLLNLLDAISYGLITFPLSNKIFENFGPDGISMFFVSCIVSQIVYSGGGSIFGGGNGSMMIEVVPFLHIMAEIIETTVKESGQKSFVDETIVSTTMISFALSSILTGACFLLMGALKLGSLIEFFPRHILVGCIGGVGWFLFVTAIEVCAGTTIEFSLEILYKLFLEGHNFALWSSALGLAILLRIIDSKIHHSLVVPIYFMIVPLIFYAIIYIFGFSWESLRQEHWVFNLPSEDVPWYNYFSHFDFTKINYYALFQTVPAMFALTFFGILHVPINVPALGVSLNEDNVDTNRELVAHGLSNILSGCFGSVQNYLVYTNSVLFIKSGGDSRVAGLMLAAGTAIILFVGPWVVGYIPVMVVGALIFHLGIDLLKEALIDTWKMVDRIEYFTIVAIVVAMASLGFIEGIFLGIIMACVFFVVSNSRKSAIRATFLGNSISSTVRRRYRQQKFLRQVGSQIYAIKLQGYLFFGTISGVEKEIRRVLTYSEWKRNPIRFLILDFNLVTGLDFSAAEAFLRIQRLLHVKGVHLVICGTSYGSEAGRALTAIGMWRDEPYNIDSFIQFHENFNEALESCENYLLTAYYQRISSPLIRNNDALNSTQPMLNNPSNSIFDISSPRNGHIQKIGENILSVMQNNKNSSRPTSVLMNTFQDITDKKEDFFDRLAPYFHEEQNVPSGLVLWHQGEIPDCLYIVERGMLRATWHATEVDPSRPVESILPYTMAGELGFFTNRKRDATLVAESDCTLWKMERSDFNNLLDKDPKTANEFMQLSLNFSAERLIAMTYYAFHLSR